MTKLEAVIEKLRALPEDRQEAVLQDMLWRIEDEQNGGVLTDAQWAEVDRALADENEPTIAHGDLVARLRKYDR